jgi:16S rRNA (cytidine1402-2'-O)-methyltransferase
MPHSPPKPAPPAQEELPHDCAPEPRPGALYVVATPIGNREDLSPRARALLARVDAIAAEDTRTSGALLAHFGIQARLVALHEHNEDRLSPALVARLKRGESLALISDAGTPLVSDPGFALVRAARAQGVPVYAVPGPCAAVAALSVSGLPCDRFVFEGFLPAARAARRARLQALAREPRTLIVYESAHRIAACLEDVVAVLGAERHVCLARELTKRFEESHTASAAEVRAWQAAQPQRARGEFVLVIAGAPPAPAHDDAERVLRALLRELPASRAARLAAELTGAPRRALYELALRLTPSAARPQ